MNIGESNAVSTLLRWITRTPGVLCTDPPSDGEARHSAAYLADRARLTMAAGMTSAEVRDRWPADRTQRDRELDEHELQALRRLAAITCSDSCGWQDMTRGLADCLRDACPDLSDVALARILLRTGGLLAHYVHLRQLTGRQAAGVINGAAAELAALEIGDPSQ